MPHREPPSRPYFIFVRCVVGGILIAFVVPFFVPSPYSDSSRVRRVERDFDRAAAAFRRFVADRGRSPAGWSELEEGGSVEPLRDPWTNERYLWEVREGGGVEVISHGADGERGGVGADADLRRSLVGE